MDKLYYDDFNVMSADENGHWVKVEELNKMIEAGVIKLDKEKLDLYHAATRVIR